MAAYLSNFYDGIESLVGAAVPSLLQTNGGGGIWRANRIMRTPLNEVLTAYGTPFGTIHIARMPTGDWGMSNYAYEPQVECYLVRDDGEDEEGMWLLLEALRDRFESEIATHTLAVGQVLEVTDLSWSPTLPMNATAIDKQMNVLAGMVAVRCVVGEIGP